MFVRLVCYDCRSSWFRVVCLTGQLTLPYVLDIFIQLTTGLKHLHESCGVLHRDLSCDNAVVQSLEPLVVKWTSFGRSVKVKPASAAADHAAQASDVFLLGCTFIELLTGCSRTPFDWLVNSNVGVAGATSSRTFDPSWHGDPLVVRASDC